MPRQNCGAKCGASPARNPAAALDSRGFAMVSMGEPRTPTMFVRVKKIGGYEYLYLVENVREGGRHVQRVIKALGRRDEVENSWPARRPHRFRRPAFPPLHRTVQLLPRRTRGDPPPQHRPRPGVRPSLAADRMPGGAAPASGRTALWLRRRARDLPDGPAPADGLRLRPPCQHMATDARRPPCPCCGGRMIIIETFQRWMQPRAPPVCPAPTGTVTP